MPPINTTSADGIALPWAQFAALAQACDPRPKASSPAPTDDYSSTTTPGGRGGPGRTRPTVAGNATTPAVAGNATSSSTPSPSRPPQADCQFFDTNYGNFCSLLSQASDVNTAANMTYGDFAALQVNATRFVQQAGNGSFVLPDSLLQNCTLLAEQAGLRANPPTTTTTVTPHVGGGDGPAVQPWGWVLIAVASVAVVAGAVWCISKVRERRNTATSFAAAPRFQGVEGCELSGNASVDANALEQEAPGRHPVVAGNQLGAADPLQQDLAGVRAGEMNVEGTLLTDASLIATQLLTVRRGFDGHGEVDTDPFFDDDLGIVPPMTNAGLLASAQRQLGLQPAAVRDVVAERWRAAQARIDDFTRNAVNQGHYELLNGLHGTLRIGRMGDIPSAVGTRIPGIHGNTVRLGEAADYPAHMVHQYPLTTGAADGVQPANATNSAYMVAFLTAVMGAPQRVMLDLTSNADRAGGRLKGQPEWYPHVLNDVIHYKGFDVTCTDVTPSDAAYDHLTLRITNTVTNDVVGKSMIHYKQWPDHGAPVDDFFVRLMRDHVVLLAGDEGVIINCTAGVGRSGTAAVLFEIEKAAHAGVQKSYPNVMYMIHWGRVDRAPQFVQTEVQLRYLLGQQNLQENAPRQAAPRIRAAVAAVAAEDVRRCSHT